MNTKVKVAGVVVVALTSTGMFAQSISPRAVKFGDEAVTLRFNDAPFSEELSKLWDATNAAVDPVEQERLWRIRWEDYGETVALQSLANYHLDRGDLVAAYAHLYAVDKIAKWIRSAAPSKPGPLVSNYLDTIEAQAELVGKELTENQRKAGVKLAAALIRNNQNCCKWP